MEIRYEAPYLTWGDRLSDEYDHQLVVRVAVVGIAWKVMTGIVLSKAWEGCRNELNAAVQRRPL